MATIRREIEVDAAPADVRAIWSRFATWAHRGPGRLACDEIACIDAVRAGLVTFGSAQSGGTIVGFSLETAEAGLSENVLERHLSHDLVIFKDYVERGGVASGKPTAQEDAVLELDASRQGDPPRHVRLSDEDDTTFWRSHFPT